jgi:hypothetical protein
MRVAAALAHRFPEVAVRLGDGDRLLAELGWGLAGSMHPAGTMGAGPVMRMQPCGFRSAVRQAMETHLRGRSQRFLDATGDPSVQIGVVAPDVCRPGGILRLGGPQQRRYVLATTTEPPRCRDIVTEAVERFPDGLLSGIGIIADREMRVSIVVAEVSSRATTGEGVSLPPCEELPILELLESIMATCAVESLLAHLAEGSLLGEG